MTKSTMIFATEKIEILEAKVAEMDTKYNKVSTSKSRSAFAERL